MNLRDIQKKFIPKPRLGTVSFDHRNYHPDAIIPQPPHRITRDGAVLPELRGVSKVCLVCNGNKVIPMRLPGLTLYECLTCGHKWRDSYDKPGQVLRPRQWRAIRREVGHEYGRILI